MEKIICCGQPSYCLKGSNAQAAITVLGGMLGPVVFRFDDGETAEPYAVAPWAEEKVGPEVPAVIAALRGDWFCSAFGENRDLYKGKRLPLHGETANRNWRFVASGVEKGVCWVRIETQLPSQGGYCYATTTIVEGQTVIYQRHDLTGLTGPINPGHHATLAFSDAVGEEGILSFSRYSRAFTYPDVLRDSGGSICSFLAPGIEIERISSVQCRDGSATNLERYPARSGFDDIAMLCAHPLIEIGWSAVTYTRKGYVWFAIRNASQLVSTLLWFSNGGFRDAPWNGRHRRVLGIEDITAYFHIGLAASSSSNFLNEAGIRTCLHPDDDGRLSIPYIQGVVRVPNDFGKVEVIEPTSDETIVLRATSGQSVRTKCRLSFLQDIAPTRF